MKSATLYIMRRRATALLRLLPIISLVITAIIYGPNAKGATTTDAPKEAADTVVPTTEKTSHYVIRRDAIAPEAALDRDSQLGHFTWGADLGSSVDLTANDMSSIDINGYFGYKGPWVQFVGVGAGITSMLSNSSRCYPVYAMVRSSFTRTPSLCFLDLRAGVSFNSIMDFQSQTDFFGSIGVGFSLAKGRKFSSHIILSYNFMPLRPYRTLQELPVEGETFEGEEPAPSYTTVETRFPNLHFASVRIGCAF